MSRQGCATCLPACLRTPALLVQMQIQRPRTAHSGPKPPFPPTHPPTHPWAHPSPGVLPHKVVGVHAAQHQLAALNALALRGPGTAR